MMILILTAATVLTLSGCSGRGPVAVPASPPPPAVPQPSPPVSTSPAADSTPWLTVDSAGRTLTLSLEVTAPAGAPSALINGYRAGQARIIVPVGWTVRWHWRNTDSSSPHSLVVMVQREKIPLEGGRAAFSNAMTRMVTEGLPAGGTDDTTFEAEEVGWYWLMCGVPGHALKGEWLELRVDQEVRTASVLVKNS